MADTVETIDPNADSEEEEVMDESVREEEEEVYEEVEVEAGEEAAEDSESGDSKAEEEEEEVDLEAAAEEEEPEAAPRSSPVADDSSAKKDDTDDGCNLWLTIICCLLFFTVITAAIAIPLRLRHDGGGTIVRSTAGGSTTGGGTGGGGPTTPTAPSTPTATDPPGTAPTMAPAPSTPAPTSVNLGQFLENFLIPRFGEEPFQDPNSPTYKAANHMASNDTYIFEGPVTSEEELGDRYAATLLYFGLGGESWPNCGLFTTTTCATGNNWLEGDHCTWAGIECTNGRVRSVQMSAEFTGTSLTGTIPPEISLFTELEEFIIQDEMLEGKLPTTLSMTLTNLNLSGNSLTGFVPDELLTLAGLEILDLCGNAMSGPLPRNLNQLTAMEQLFLAENAFSGTVPTTFGDLANLSTYMWDFFLQLLNRSSKSLTRLSCFIIIIIVHRHVDVASESAHWCNSRKSLCYWVGGLDIRL
jgi:hypothetical protein